MAIPSGIQIPDGPYKGLMPYAEEDAPFFYGREAEREVITSNLMASRLTLLYGASGVGKSSVLRAGVAHHLRQQARQAVLDHGTPDTVVVTFSDWRDDPLAGLVASIDDGIARAVGGAPDGAPSRTRDLADVLATWADRLDADLLIVLDQFEEYFLYHGRNGGAGTFATEFARVLNRTDLRANFLLAIREDALARLDQFKGRIPYLFDNYLRIEHLNRTAARAAIIEPIAAYNRLHADERPPAEIEPALVEAVLEQVAVGQVSLADVGRGAVTDGTAGTESRIETPYLQLVMTRLWEEETDLWRRDGWLHPGPRALRRDTLERLGGAERIVRTHLDTAMGGLPARQQEIAARAFHFLVTASGTKIAHTTADLADYAETPEAELAPVLERLAAADTRILRPVAPPLDQPGAPRYEIFHDVLAPALTDWRTRHAQEQERAQAEAQLARERRRVSRLRLGIVGLSLLVLAMVGLLIFAVVQRNTARRAEREAAVQRSEALAQRDAAEKARAEAQEQQKLARSRDLATIAVAQTQSNPELGLLLAIEAARESPTSQAEDALRRALLASHIRHVLRDHTDVVWDVDFSPDGRWFATASADRTARVWETASARNLAVLRGHGSGVQSVHFSADGGRIVTVGANGTVRVWDAATGEVLTRLRAESASALSAAIGPDGDRVVTAGTDNVGRVWDVASGALMIELRGHSGAVTSVAFSPDGRLLLTGSFDGTARLWDGTTGRSVRELRGHTGAVARVAFSPDGQRIATLGVDRTVRVWDAASGAALSELRGHTDLVWSAVFSPDSRLVVTASSDKTARLWEADTGRLVAELRGHTDSVGRAAFSPDGKWVITASNDRTARVWEVSTGRSVAELTGHTDKVRGAVFSPDGRWVVTTSQDGTARLWQAPTVDAVLQLRGHTDQIIAVAYHPNGGQVATAGQDGTIRLWDPATGHEMLRLVGQSEPMQSLAYSPDGQRLLATDAYYRGYIWNTATGQQVAQFTGFYDKTVRGAAYSPDGARVLTASKSQVAVRDAANGEVLQVLADHTDTVYSAAFSPSGQQIVTAGADGTARIWRGDAKAAAVLRGHRGTVYSAAFSPDERLVVTAGADGTARIWNLATGDALILRGHRGPVSSASFSPDGSLVITAGEDGTARIWEARTGRQVAELTGHTGAVRGARFSPDGRSVVTGGDDGTARIYPPEFFLPLAQLLTLATTRTPRELTSDEREQFLHEPQPDPSTSDVPIHDQDADGWRPRFTASASYEVGSNPRFTRAGAPSHYVKSIVPNPEGGQLVENALPADMYVGQGIRVAAYVSASHLEGTAQFLVDVVDDRGIVLASGAKAVTPLAQDMKWSQVDVSLDIPRDSKYIYYGVFMTGGGEAWVNDIRIELLQAGTLLDDVTRQGWFGSASVPAAFFFDLDRAATDDGHAVLLIRAIAAGSNRSTAGLLFRRMRGENAAGKRLRFTALVKTESIEGSALLTARTLDSTGKLTSTNTRIFNAKPITATTPWSRYELIIDVPQNAAELDYGVQLTGGGGTVWIDDVHLDAAD